MLACPKISEMILQSIPSSTACVAKDGFHIKDTVESQVYNNQVENEEATRAIEETAGEIMTYDGVPIDAKYFSTSAGFTSHASNVW